MENINPPVHQIYLIGPEKQGKSIARRIFPYCERCNWIPAFFISERYTKTIEKDISREGERTGVIAFGRDSEEIYDRLYGEDRQQKILRLLEPGALRMEELCMDIDFDEIIQRYQEQEVLNS